MLWALLEPRIKKLLNTTLVANEMITIYLTKFTLMLNIKKVIGAKIGSIPHA
jgi:hypothetical protein